VYIYINSLDDLSFLNEELLLKPYIGVDTEFRRTTKDNMKLALLQINDGEEIYLVDTIAINQPHDQVSFLFSKNVKKIFHSCKEDFEAIYSWTGNQMMNIFDTQLAHSLLSQDYSISYQALVEKKLDIVLEKTETRSNWIRRPLSTSQLQYAALDVEYLLHLYEDQKEQFHTNDKLEWHDQDIKKILKHTFNKDNLISELNRVLPRQQEAELLDRFNIIIKRIAEEEGINQTLFFSKKAQKYFLRLIHSEGLDTAYKEITAWRRDLIQKDLGNLLK
tara:strand:- start:341 stop:1168 length:828 start_codon:yes stop_codon:yes gene_type:complete